MMQHRVGHFPSLTAVLLLGAAICCQGSAQTKPLRNAVGISYTTMRFLPMEQYIGAGLEYRFMAKPWLGVQVQIGKFPQLQAWEDGHSGGAIVQENASILAGHRWGKIGLYGEGGAGILRTNVYKGISASSSSSSPFTYDVRHYPDVVMGGLLDISVGRRWSLTFNVRDNLTVIGPYSQIYFGDTFQITSGTVNAPEGRTGIAFHF